MKKFITVCSVAVMASFMLATGTSVAASSSKTIQGKTVSFKAGKLKVKTKKGSASYIVNKKTDCGYSQGQMGNSMPCSNLKKSKYMKKQVTVTWSADKQGRRVAELVAVHL